MSKQMHRVGLDLGTSSMRVVIAAIHPDGYPEIVGAGDAPSRGVRKGAIVNPEAAAESIRRATEAAERTAGVFVDSAYVSLSSPLLRGVNTRGVVAIAGPDCRIARSDIQRVIEMACVVTLPGGHEIIDVQPQDYMVDGQDGISDPLDMLGTRLEVMAHVITGPMTVRQNIITAVNRAGLLVDGMILEPIAAAEASLLPDEREHGSAVVNIGGDITSIAVYQRGAVQHTMILPFGGSQFTNDIAFGVRTPIPEAERIKRQHGCVLSSMVRSEGQHTIEVPSLGHRPPRNLSRQFLCQILLPRAEEILGRVRDEIRRAGVEGQLPSGLILTGGGALLGGLPELAEQMFDCSVRVGYPLNIDGLTEETDTPLLATAIGLVLVAQQSLDMSSHAAQHHTNLVHRTAVKMRDWLSSLF